MAASRSVILTKRKASVVKQKTPATKPTPGPQSSSRILNGPDASESNEARRAQKTNEEKEKEGGTQLKALSKDEHRSNGKSGQTNGVRDKNKEVSKQQNTQSNDTSLKR